MIITRTPFRVSFFGGGTDYPAWYREHGGAVVAGTIDRYCYISLRHLPPFFEHRYRIVYSKIENVREIEEIQHPAIRAVLGVNDCREGLEIHHDGDLPARSGLGSSSSFTVGLINAVAALRGRYISKGDLARRAIDIEQNVIGENVGSQDQISAAFGGLNRIDFARDGSFEVAPVVLGSRRLVELEEHLMLCFTGFSRIASEVALSTIENLAKRGDELRALRAMVDSAIKMLQDEARPIEEFGELLADGWALKRRISDRISTPEIDGLYDAARAAGAIGGKLLGAGGGGFLLLFVRPGEREAVRRTLGSLAQVPFRFESGGSRVVLYHPNGL
jgi:D-glycero-alpha-D-manno-heptose-7-phosphate kinase